MDQITYTLSNPLMRAGVRLVMRTAFAALRFKWFVTRPVTRGASAFCFAPDGTLILVHSTYERGWNLPGGGISPDETAVAAVLRELREELGLALFSEVAFLFEMTHCPNFKRDTEAVFLITDVRIEGAANLEIERIGRFTLDALPTDISPELRHRLALLARYADSSRDPALNHLMSRPPLTEDGDSRLRKKGPVLRARRPTKPVRGGG